MLADNVGPYVQQVRQRRTGLSPGVCPGDYGLTKHVLIIGGTSDIGLAVAEAALSSGANATISSSTSLKIASAVNSLGSLYPNRAVHGITSDLSTPYVEDTLTALFDAAQITSSIDRVVYTAADSLSLGPLKKTAPQGINSVAHMRMVVPILVAKTAARLLPPSSLSSITLTTGSVAQRPSKGWAEISCFAGGLASLTRALAVDLAPVRVNAVQPGVVDTGLWDYMGEEERKGFVKGVEEGMLTGRMGRVEDLAEAYLWVMKDGNCTETVARTDEVGLLVWEGAREGGGRGRVSEDCV
ncbi:short chain dehydrogenase [Immersiella caudata]|uniref:Short chain dehydrogenase n=1 Tax=Immersiella caudata TaxID=314043 RepID=A0AA39XFF0_9PEZI|nr:short chain dehydrogenase [Immersiella caudata]